MVYKSLNDGSYGEYTKYDSIRKLRTAHANVYGASVEGVMNSSHTEKTLGQGVYLNTPPGRNGLNFFLWGVLN